MTFLDGGRWVQTPYPKRHWLGLGSSWDRKAHLKGLGESRTTCQSRGLTKSHESPEWLGLEQLQ